MITLFQPVMITVILVLDLVACGLLGVLRLSKEQGLKHRSSIMLDNLMCVVGISIKVHTRALSPVCDGRRTGGAQGVKGPSPN